MIGRRSERLTANRNERSRDDDFLPVLVLQSLTEHVHVQTTVEAKSEALTEERGRLAIRRDTSVGQGELIEERQLSIEATQGGALTRRIASSSLGNPPGSIG